MKLELKTRWTEKLRSGEYEQVRRRLGDSGNGRCCIGVLADVAKAELENACCVFGRDREGNMLIDSGHGSIPQNGLNAIGLTSEHEACAICLNDARGKNFSEIADWIDATVPIDPEPELAA